MTLVKVAPDTEYGVDYIAIRFTVPRDLPRHLLEAAAYPTLKRAIEQIERLGDGRGHHYRFRDDLPIYYRVARLQGPADWCGPGNAWTADDWFARGYVDWVALLAFEQVMLAIEEDPAEAVRRAEEFEEWKAQFRETYEAVTPADAGDMEQEEQE